MLVNSIADRTSSNYQLKLTNTTLYLPTKFAYKYGFKGPCNGTSKLIKGIINRLEMKLTCIANDFGYYMQLSKELTKDKNDHFTQLKH